MSRSNPNLVNPASHFMEWSGSRGALSWYNKETKANVPVKLPFEFLVLDELSTITGYSSQDESGYWSNEVRSVAKEELTVRTKKGIKQIGFYTTLADVRAKGAKYTKSVYIAHKVGDEWVIGNIKMAGSALSAWIEFSQVYKVQNGKATMEKGDEAKTPKGDSYYPPTFKYLSATPEENTKAIELDKQLQVYLAQYLAAPAITEAEDEIVNGATTTDLRQDLPPSPMPSRQQRNQTPVLDQADERFPVEYEDEPFNDDQIPF